MCREVFGNTETRCTIGGRMIVLCMRRAISLSPSDQVDNVSAEALCTHHDGPMTTLRPISPSQPMLQASDMRENIQEQRWKTEVLSCGKMKN